MDFLDPKKTRQQNIMLFVGYFLIGIAIVTTALVLLYQSNGFGINKEGEVIQNGLVFTGTTPDNADIYVDGKDSGFNTNKRLVLAAGEYALQFKKDGYRSWSRNIDVEGGSVNRFDYAFLFPTKLETATIKSYALAPGLASQSPDRRWILVQYGTDFKNYEVYDLKNPAKTPVQLTVPATIMTSGANESVKLVEWSNDNSHVLLRHNFGSSYEYILVDRESPDQSRNLTQLLGTNPTELRLVDKKYDRYYLYDATTKQLSTANLNAPQPVSYIKNVLAYKSYSDNMMLYVTDDIKTTDSAPGQVAVKLAIGDQTYTIRKVQTGNKYLLEIAKYSGDLYVVAGVDVENKALVYKNPVSQINDPDIGVAVQVASLRVAGPNFVSFSDNTRYMMAENGSSFAVYDAEVEKSYSYGFTNTLDAPQEHASWMDGNRMMYVSGGKLFVFDYDKTNRQTLAPANANYTPAFAPDYKRLFMLNPTDTTGASTMSRTWLRTADDR